MVTILFLSILLVVLFIYNRYTFLDKQALYEQRIRSMNGFLNDFYDDANDRAIYITTARAFISMDEYISSNHAFLTNVSHNFTGLFINGTLGNETMTYMAGATFQDYLDKVKLNAQSINLNLEANVTNATVEQFSPWYVNISVNISINLSDNSGVAVWRLNKTLQTKVSIIDLRDPFYTRNCQQAVSIIRRSPYQLIDLVDDTGDINDTTKFTDMIERTNHSTYFFASEYAPSFLMRYEGNYSNSTYGIFSFVDLHYLSNQGCWVTENKSSVDYIYFDWWFNASEYTFKDASCHNIPAYESICNVQNMPEWFRILLYDGAFYDAGCGETPALGLLDALDLNITDESMEMYLDFDSPSFTGVSCGEPPAPGPPEIECGNTLVEPPDEDCEDDIHCDPGYECDDNCNCVADSAFPP
ncbi:MAG: hypothetical protein V1678_05530 [Candidatus Aenigmatarchaeota archaeon]